MEESSAHVIDDAHEAVVEDLEGFAENCVHFGDGGTIELFELLLHDAAKIGEGSVSRKDTESIPPRKNTRGRC
jgi:hypothetical protein